MSAEVTRAAIYTRVSTSDQASEGFSLEEQERRCRAEADAEGWDAEVFQEAGVSGKLASRPALDRMLARLDEFDVIICYSLDRLGRSTANLLKLYDRIEVAGVRLIFIRERLDTSTPVGRLLRTVLSAIAEFEREMIVDRAKGGIGARARSGKPWGAPKYGYLRGGDGDWVQDPFEAEIVQRILRYRVERRLSYSRIARTLIAEKVPTRSGGNWTATTVKKICENRYALGYFTHNGEEIRGRHEPIIDEPTWIAAQKLAAEGSKFAPSRPGRRPARHVFVTGHGRCHYCKESLITRGDWYECRTNKVLRGVGSCPMPRLRREVVDAHWLDFFERTFVSLEKTREHVAAELDQRIREIDRELASAEVEFVKVSDRRARLDEDYLAGKLSAESFERFLARLTEEESATRAQRDRLRASAEEARRATENVDAEEEMLCRMVSLRDSIVADAQRAQETGDLHALRAISRELAEEVYWAVDPDGHPRIAGLTPGSRLYVPVAAPGEENAVAVRFERDHVFPLTTGGTYLSGSGVPE